MLPLQTFFIHITNIPSTGFVFPKQLSDDKLASCLDLPTAEFPSPGSIFEPPGSFKKIPMPSPHPRQIKSESMGVVFFKEFQMILTAN